MRVHVKLFAIVRQLAGRDALELDLPDGATVESAAGALAEREPALGAWMHRVAFAVNQAYAPRDMILRDGDELAVIPPVSGG